MNILPKKSWHVRNKDNVAKVRKDEEEARQKEKLRLQQVALAEQETRTALLRNKARKALTRKETDDGIVSLIEENSHRPINFFQDIGPDGKPYDAKAGNVEHEKEKQQEKEKAEKKIGLLTYLGQSAVETMGDDERPWYFKPPRRENNADNRSDKLKVADNKRKASLDPLIEMKEHLHKKKKHKSHKKKTKKHSSSSKDLSADDKMAKLRKARLEREAKEKQKSLNMLQKHYGVVSDEQPETSSSHFKQKYSNQFNPHLARNNR